MGCSSKLQDWGLRFEDSKEIPFYALLVPYTVDYSYCVYGMVCTYQFFRLRVASSVVNASSGVSILCTVCTPVSTSSLTKEALDKAVGKERILVSRTYLLSIEL